MYNGSSYRLSHLTGYVHECFRGQFCQCLEDDGDEGEGGVGGKQLETELSNLGGCSDVVTHQGEDGNQPQLQSNRSGQPWSEKND